MSNKLILQENEEIRDIEGYEGLYAITSHGRVWSYRSNKFLKPDVKSAGYYNVKLSKNTVSKHYYVHRLVAQAFLANPNGLPQVNHKDETKENNCVSNLEWCDSKYNNNYGTRTQKIMKPVRCIELNRVFESGVAAAEAIGISSSGHITECCRGKRYTCGGYHWEYVNEGSAAAC